jgi:hypothetical protein
MAKSPTRSNREARKPKAIKIKPEAAAAPVIAVTKGAPPRKPKGVA